MNIKLNKLKAMRYIRYTFIFFSILMISMSISSAATYYVAKNGNDNNPGTEAQPWQTIQNAADTLVAGETLYVKEGTYNEKITIKKSGSPGNYIIFAAYPGHTVTIDGTGIAVPVWDALFTIYGASYINLSGFSIKNSKFAGIMATSDYGDFGPKNYPTNIIIEKNYISNTASSAIFIEEGRNVVIDGNEITRAQTMEGLSSQVHEPITLTRVDGFEIKNNKLYDNMFESINAKEGSRNGKIHHNDISQHYSAGIYIDAYDRAAYNIEIFSNKIYDGKATARGIAIAVENGGSLKNVKVYNNVIYNNAATGIDVSWYSTGPIDDISIISNTIYNNGLIDEWGVGISLGYDPATNVVVRNNIISKNKHKSIRSNDFDAVIENNLIDGYFGGGDERKGNNYVEGDPQFLNPSSVDFRLKSTSPAIDKGSPNIEPSVDFNGNSRPQGAGYDIGAYEYITTTPIPEPIRIIHPPYQQVFTIKFDNIRYSCNNRISNG